MLISFAEPQYTFAENDGSVSIVVVKSGDTDRPITVRVAGGKGYHLCVPLLITKFHTQTRFVCLEHLTHTCDDLS